jgi:tetratricopeptide (TPR) repeat protein
MVTTKKAVSRYTYLTDTLDVREDEVMINLANSYFQVKDTANAITAYQSSLQVPRVTSVQKHSSNWEFCTIDKGKLEEALANFKEAIKADKSNVDAKYDYEMLKKKLDEEKKKQDEKNRNKPKEPSAYAKRVKAQADGLLAKYRFSEAESLMNEGAKRDPSVLYYEDFMKRLKEVVTIDKSK